jgi:uncharacterized lipoprotein YehR (DUF1307 family)
MKCKKAIAFVIVFAVLFALTACGASAGNAPSVSPAAPSTKPSEPVQEPSKAAESPSSSEAVGTAAAGKIVEPSMLITKEQAKELLNGEISDTEDKEQKAVGQKITVYYSGDKMLQVSLQQQALMKNGQTPESIYRAIVENYKDAEKAEGVGDEAYFCTPGIHILKSGYYIQVSMGLASDKKNREKLTEAGKTAVAGLEAALKG